MEPDELMPGSDRGTNEADRRPPGTALQAQSDRSSRLVSRFTRVTTSGNYIPEIDGLRFVAIGSVLLFHIAINLAARNSVGYKVGQRDGKLGAFLANGDFGVQLFFIVSGFVLAIPFARHGLLGARKVRLGAYYLRRVTRLEPPYFIAMISIFLFLVVVRSESAGSLFPHLLAGLFYVHNITFGTDNIVNNVAWSLEVEIQFYLLVPILAYVFRVKSARNRRLILCGSILLFAAVGPLIAGQSPYLHNTILRFGQYFLAGLLLADYFVSQQLGRSRRPLMWDAGAIIAAVAVVFFNNSIEYGPLLPSQRWLNDLLSLCLLPFLCIVACCGVFRGTLVRAILTNRWITLIGGMCYSIYLLHNVILGNALSITKSFAPTGNLIIDFSLQAVGMAILVLIVSAVFFILIERPCMDRTWPARLGSWFRRSISIRVPWRRDTKAELTMAPRE